MRISLIGTPERSSFFEQIWRMSASVVQPSQGAHAVTLCGMAKEQIQHIRKLTRKGVPMLVDLPLGSSVYEIESAFADAERARVTCLPATWMRAALPVQLARDAVLRGTIGTVSHVEICLPGEPSLFHTGFHAADLAGLLLGPFERVSTESIPEGRKLVMSTRYGATCEAVLGMWQPYVCRIRGSHGTIDIGWSGSHIFRDGAPRVCIGEDLSEAECMQRLTTRFQGVLYGEETPWISFDELMANLDVMDAAARSLVQGEELEVAQLAAA